MGNVLVAVLFFIAAILFLAWFVKIYTAYCYKKLVTDRYELVNSLMETGEVPYKWRIRWLERIALMGGRNRMAEAVGCLLIRWYIKRLKGVISFVLGSNVFSDTDKLTYKDILESVRLNWEKYKGLDDLITPL